MSLLFLRFRNFNICTMREKQINEIMGAFEGGDKENVKDTYNGDRKERIRR